MVSASVIMFILASLFFNLNLFGGLSDVSTILDPKMRLYLSSALSLFLPVMSYLFSEAKNAGLVCSKDSTMSVAAPTEEVQVRGDGRRQLVLEASPAGYRLADDTYLSKLAIQASPAAYNNFAKDVVTVGRIWELAESDNWLFTSFDQGRRLRRLCLSFALFKLLRRRFEHLPAMTEVETRNCRDLIFKGLYKKGTNDGGDDKAEALFQMLNDKAYFLSEYYHSVVPVVLASPFFLLANYFLLPFIVLVLCLVIIVLCGNGNVLFAFRSMKSDNYSISFGVSKMAKCLLSRVLTSPSVFFSTIDFSITLLLILILVYEEVWEFFVFMLSNWFVVSLLCRYTARPHWRDSPIFSWERVPLT